MKIYAPVTTANGVYASVRFVNGVGETNNPALIEWFRKHGYRVEDVPKTVVKDAVVPVTDVGKMVDDTEFVEINKLADDSDKPNFEAMTPIELREWAKANGYAGVIKNIRNKEKLLELIRG